MPESQTIIEVSNAVTSKAAMTTALGGAASVAARFADLDPIAVVGLLIGFTGLFVSVASFFINVYYKRLENKRAAEIHRLRVAELKGQYHGKD